MKTFYEQRDEFDLQAELDPELDAPAACLHCGTMQADGRGVRPCPECGERPFAPGDDQATDRRDWPRSRYC